MADSTVRSGQIVSFVRKRDYKLVKELGQGACGQTVLLHDDQIDEHFVCKKYVPYAEAHRETLFANFVREVKLLHQVHHENLVRVFNYYLYPEQHAGFILMEYIDGTNIDRFLSDAPERANEVFLQAIAGFAHLERAGILHRDIRPANLMVRADGTLKIIDLGFGKRIDTSEDFDKSITLNWWCAPPAEFRSSKYDFQTEVYFVGKLFEEIICDNEISHFRHTDLLRRMCSFESSPRPKSFTDIEKELGNEKFHEIDFEDDEIDTYRWFARELREHFVWLDSLTAYVTDHHKVVSRLGDAYRGFMLEEFVPDSARILGCFVQGPYRYKPKDFPVQAVNEFLILFRAATEEKKRIILGNIHTNLDAVPRHQEPDDDIPF
ncbi:MAG: protein kinase family protein [Myxococcales bacterium]|nr:protein kinase family protein [Myxococcales bacterium]